MSPHRATSRDVLLSHGDIAKPRFHIAGDIARCGPRPQRHPQTRCCTSPAMSRDVVLLPGRCHHKAFHTSPAMSRDVEIPAADVARCYTNIAGDVARCGSPRRTISWKHGWRCRAMSRAMWRDIATLSRQSPGELYLLLAPT